MKGPSQTRCDTLLNFHVMIVLIFMIEVARYCGERSQGVAVVVMSLLDAYNVGKLTKSAKRVSKDTQIGSTYNA